MGSADTVSAVNIGIEARFFSTVLMAVHLLDSQPGEIVPSLRCPDCAFLEMSNLIDWWGEGGYGRFCLRIMAVFVEFDALACPFGLVGKISRRMVGKQINTSWKMRCPQSPDDVIAYSLAH
jgi:hypothetical protein